MTWSEAYRPRRSRTNNYGPVWTPDGERVVFTSDRDGPWNMYWKSADGTGDVVRLTTSEKDQWASAFAPDGRLVFEEYTDTTGSNIWMLSMEGDRRLEPVTRSRFTEWGAMFSPDSRLVAYSSDDQGPYEIYVQPYPGGGPRVKISSDGGAEPIWSPSGDALFFMHNNGHQWMVAPINTDATFRPGTPRVFVDGPYRDVLGRSHDVAQDGRRLLLIRGSNVRTASHLNVVVNWFEELKRLVPNEH